MRLDIQRNGIARRPEEGGTRIWTPDRHGGVGAETEVGDRLADLFRLATGDVAEGEAEPLRDTRPPAALSDECVEDLWAEGQERDEPAALRGGAVAAWIAARPVTRARLVSVARVNGLPPDEAEERPFPRAKRHASERIAPDRLFPLALGPDDTTGRLLDFAAPLGAGDAGVVYGPHGAGLTRALRAVVGGVRANAPDVLVFVLLMRARGEEATEWRRLFPAAEVIACPAASEGATPEQTLDAADLVMECVQRQTELGRDALLAVDSLTGLWAAMLEAESALDQSDADTSRARRRLREWAQRAGCFRGAGLLGSGLGGSLTLVGTAWHRGADAAAEEDRELHPHLRLLEHLLHETAWRVPLDPVLADARLFPAIDAARCVSRSEGGLLPPDLLETLAARRGALARLPSLESHRALLDALDATPDLPALLAALAPPAPPPKANPLPF